MLSIHFCYVILIKTAFKNEHVTTWFSRYLDVSERNQSVGRPPIDDFNWGGRPIDNRNHVTGLTVNCYRKIPNESVPLFIVEMYPLKKSLNHPSKIPFFHNTLFAFKTNNNQFY